MKKLSLRVLLLIVVSLISLLLTGMLLIFGTRFAKDLSLSRVRRNYEDQTKQLAEVIQEKLNNYENLLHVITNNQLIKESDSKPESMDMISRTLNGLLQAEKNTKLTWMAFEDGKITFMPQISVPDLDPRERPWYIKSKDVAGVIFIEPYVDYVSKRPVMSFAQRVRDMNGRFLGVVGMDIDFGFLKDYLMSSKYMITQENYILVNSTGEIVEASTDKEIPSQVVDWVKSNIAKNMLGSEKFSIGDKKEVAALYHQIPKYGITVVSTVDFSVINNETSGVSSLVLKVSGFAAVILIGMGLVVSEIIIKPINSIRKEVEHILAGKDIEKAKREKTYQGELGKLYKEFLTLHDRLQNYKGYISEISTAISSVAEGDLTVDLKLEYIGEFSKIKDAYNLSKNQLSEIILQLQKTSQNLKASGSNVSAAASAVAEATERQSMEIDTINKQMVSISDDAKNGIEFMSDMMNKSDSVTEKINMGNEQMEHMVASMTKIRSSAEEIQKIIKMIDDIAFQTNILALNAAVEAARAGEAGRGFAVVADEVRNLANKSAEAVKQTEIFINESIESVTGGDEVTKELSETLVKITEANQSVAETINVLKGVVTAQSESINNTQVNIDSVSGQVQSNSATSEETAAIASELQTSINEIDNLISRFKV